MHCSVSKYLGELTNIFLFLVSNLLPLSSKETIHMISLLVNVLGFVLWPRAQAILGNALRIQTLHCGCCTGWPGFRGSSPGLSAPLAGPGRGAHLASPQGPVSVAASHTCCARCSGPVFFIFLVVRVHGVSGFRVFVVLNKFGKIWQLFLGTMFSLPRLSWDCRDTAALLPAALEVIVTSWLALPDVSSSSL